QDQHYHLPTRPEPLLDGHGDRELARHALLEGDATLAGFAYVLGRQLDRRMIGVVEQQLHGVPAELAKKYPDLPELLRASLAFQYDDGTAFVGQALAAGGWAAVDRAHLDPPESTEQVLHPARYYADRDRPIAVRLGGTDGLEAAGFRRILEDTLGELEIRVLVARALPAQPAAGVAAGWGGDRLRAREPRDRTLEAANITAAPPARLEWCIGSMMWIIAASSCALRPHAVPRGTRSRNGHAPQPKRRPPHCGPSSRR